MLKVTLDGLDFIGAEWMGRTGFIIKPGGWKGWESGSSTTGERIKIPNGDGDFDLPVFRNSRIVSVSGTAVARSLAELTAMGDQFNGLLDEGPGPLMVEMGDESRWAIVDLDDSPEFVPLVGGKTFLAKFSLQVWAPDPLKFGFEPRSFAAGQEARHYGNTTAPLTHTVTGAMPSGYTIGGPVGRQFKVNAPLVAGVPHVIDGKTGELYIGGELTAELVDIPDIWGIPRGTVVVHTLTGAGTGQLVTELFDTYK